MAGAVTSAARRMKEHFLPAALLVMVAATGWGQAETELLPVETVYSPRVANQQPAASFPMPISALRYEPLVDVQARNLAEGQADVTIRGGIFENTGFSVGALTLVDPQTGHYFAEIPIAPAMLGAPDILTGVAHALGAINSTVGAIAYAWRPIRTGGRASIAAGDYGFNRQEIYQGYARAPDASGRRLAADVNWARSEGDGTIPFGDHSFQRVNARLQFATSHSQTDVMAGYQTKFFGWPNLYTPYNSKESENLQTTLLIVNHREDLGGGDYLEAGAYRRRNKDDYAYNRFAPLGTIHPYQHTTWVNGAAATVRKALGAVTLNARAEVLADELRSTSLTAGRYRTRTLSKLALVPEKSWRAADGGEWTVKAGATLDDSNRGGSAVSPVFEVAREQESAAWRRVYFSYAKSTQVPTYTALNSSASAGLFRGNPNLGRESSQTMELGAQGDAAGWATRAAVFYRRDDALVDWTYKRGVTARTANPVDLDTTGFEAEARQAWGRRVDVVLGYTYLTKSPDYRGAAVDASFYALNYARHRLTVAITARLGAGFELRMDNVVRRQAENLLRTAGGESAVISSLTLAWRPPTGRGLEISAGADNLWNSSFQEVPSVPAARRQLFVGVGRSW